MWGIKTPDVPEFVSVEVACLGAPSSGRSQRRLNLRVQMLCGQLEGSWDVKN